MESNVNAEPSTPPVSRARAWGCFALLMVAWYAIAGPVVRPGAWGVRLEEDQRHVLPLLESHAWLAGRWDLPDQGGEPLHTRLFDTAYIAETNRVYAFYPPLMTGIYAAFLLIDRHVLAFPDGAAGPWLMFTVVALPVIVLGYWAFMRQTGSPEWGGVLALVLACATANYPMMVWGRNGAPGYVAHLLSQTGILLIVGGALGRRFWPAAIGIPIAVWSRQLTIVYALVAVLLAWRRGRRRDFVLVAASLALTVGAQLGLNCAKFGSPWESGYRLIYEGREDELAERGRRGLFSTEWIRENLAYMVWDIPQPSLSNTGFKFATSLKGNSLFFTTPIALVALAAVWVMRREGWRMAFFAATLPVIGAILLYHAPGVVSTGCYRFGMDFVPVWLVAAAPVLVRPKWRWWTLGCAAWGLVYFQMTTLMEGL